jgi:hypothetical protein
VQREHIDPRAVHAIPGIANSGGAQKEELIWSMSARSGVCKLGPRGAHYDFCGRKRTRNQGRVAPDLRSATPLFFSIRVRPAVESHLGPPESTVYFQVVADSDRALLERAGRLWRRTGRGNSKFTAVPDTGRIRKSPPGKNVLPGLDSRKTEAVSFSNPRPRRRAWEERFLRFHCAMRRLTNEFLEEPSRSLCKERNENSWI